MYICKKKVDYIIIGQEINADKLSNEFSKAGLSFAVMDDGNPSASSRVAAGMINPVTGRRIVKTWMIDTLLPFAFETYKEFGKALDIEAIKETPVIDFFPNLQMRSAFFERVHDIPEFLEEGSDGNYYENF